MKKEYNQTPKSIAFSLLTLANELKKNQTNNIIINNSYLSHSFNPLATLSSQKGMVGGGGDSYPHLPTIKVGNGVGGSKFNAKTEAINYSNNKLNLENSKFLNKNKTYPTTPSLLTTKIESLDLVNLNTKVDLTKFSFNKKIVLNNKDKLPLSAKDRNISIPTGIFSYPPFTPKGDSYPFGNNPSGLLKLGGGDSNPSHWGGSRFSKGGKIFNKKKNTTLYKYISHITKSNNIINTNPNLSKKYGLLLKYNREIGYNFINKINSIYPPSLNIGGKNINLISEYKEETYKLLFYFFKSIYCLISKPTILFSPDKITIRLFYYLMIPKRKVFNLFSINYNKKIQNKWIENKFKTNKRKKRLSDFKKVDSIFNLNIHSNDKSNKFNFNQNVNLNPKNIRLPFMKFKIRKAISRLKSKPALIKKVYFYLINFNLVKVFHNKFLIITNILSKLFNKPVTLEITRIHNFKFDTNILANAIQLVMKNKKKNPKLAINKVYKKKNIKILNDPNLISKNNIISFLSGLNIYINGRIMREPIIPRITTKKYEKGATATGKVNYLDTSFITKKNRKGAYTIKVKAAQNFF